RGLLRLAADEPAYALLPARRARQQPRRPGSDRVDRVLLRATHPGSSADACGDRAELPRSSPGVARPSAVGATRPYPALPARTRPARPRVWRQGGPRSLWGQPQDRAGLAQGLAG